VADGRTEIVVERCVKCGLCVTECANSGYSPRDDLPRVRELLASGRPVVAVLASEHVAALHPLSSADVEQGLEKLGFDAVETTVLGEELVAAAYEQIHLRASDSFPRLRSTCPVVVAWVRRFYPALVSALVTVVPPYVAQARLVKAIYPADTAVVYVSPCWARKDEVFERQVDGAVDVAIGFDELKRLLAEAPVSRQASGTRRARRPQAAKDLSLTDGFPRGTLRGRDMTDGHVVAVRGLDDLDRLLRAVMRGETAPSVIDMLNCEGCVDGPAVNSELSVFAKRNLISADLERQLPPAVASRRLLSVLPSIDLRRSFDAQPALTRVPTAEEIDAVLAAGEFASRAEAIDCGACGYDTCIAHAAAICLGDSTWDTCFPLQRKIMLRERQSLAEEALVDPVSGLGNRRAFDDRLAEEVARAARYGTPLSLALLDLDRFKSVNDAWGHVAGDTVLAAVGSLLREHLRVSDIPVRYGGDEFAIILPATAKTEAWLVAEKVRASLCGLAIEVNESKSVSVPVSIGVAAFGSAHDDAEKLLAAADAALYRAKHAGRNRVELSAG
jgi:diguanylate cyclase (GGDEF)-like protein